MKAEHSKKTQSTTSSGAETTLALMRFMFDGISGMGAAKLGWEMDTDSRSTFSEVGVGAMLCLAPLLIVAVWVGCLYGIAQHLQLI
ncbi:hypothetical protein [Stenotrophomonas bentonitica]|uniref:hypothetical protein n=1 Tax=Stenotrophomonas bentonitica TaxID=1450134 RepID=UPI0031BAD1AE